MSKFYPLTVSDIRQETDDCVSVAFEVPENLQDTFEFIQGQYLTLRKEINGEHIRRSYSLCVSPLSQEWRVAIKKVKDGRFSTFANDTLKVGDTLEVMPPMGNFHTPIKSGETKHYLGFAGGSGITPVMSIINTALEVEKESTFTLFYGNKRTEDIIFRDTLDDLKNVYMNRLIVHHVFSVEKRESDLFNGFISTEKTEQFSNLLFDANKIDEAFICGPEPMMLAIEKGLINSGMAKENIHFELFTSHMSENQKEQSVAEIERPVKAQIKINQDGTLFTFPLYNDSQDSILDTALKNGMDLPFACKGGVCCTCKAKKLSGEVKMLVNYGLEPDEIEAGYILTCQSFPTSEEVEIVFE